MARVNNPIFNGFRGRLGNDGVFKTRIKKTYFEKIPDMSRIKPSKNQSKGRGLFGEAVKFAQSVLNDPEQKKKYSFRKAILPITMP